MPPIRAVAILPILTLAGMLSAAAPGSAPSEDDRLGEGSAPSARSGSAPAGKPSVAPNSPDPVLTPRPPTAKWDFGRVNRVELLTFAPGGKLYARVELTAVNVWAVIAWYWPEAVAFPVVFLCALLVWRALRDRRTSGEWYCAGCNYPLRGLTSDRCPECGLALGGAPGATGGSPASAGATDPSTLADKPPVAPAHAGRVLARRRGRRIALSAVLAAVTAAGYHRACDDFFPGRRVAGELFDWPSHGLWEWAEPKGIVLPEWMYDRTRIVELDPATGRRRVVRDDRWVGSGNFGLHLPAIASPDGGSLFVAQDLALIQRLDVAAGDWVADYRRYSVHRYGFDLMLTRDGAVLRELELGRGATVKRAWEVADGRPLPRTDPRFSGEPIRTRYRWPPLGLPFYSVLRGFDSWSDEPWAAYELRSPTGGRTAGVYDHPGARWVALLAVGPRPDGGAVSPDQRYAAVLDEDHTIRAFDLSDLAAPAQP